jgi:NAD(P) transhydrogenase subunit alpha
VITTALVPGQPAPRLVSREMVEGMRPGAVIVDLAVAQGGNCELSRAGEEIEHRGVLVLAPPDLAATVPLDASTVYSRNVLAFLLHLAPEGAPRVDLEDEIVRETLIAHAGEMRTAAAGAPLTRVGTGATAS